jgi:lipoyl(octanoyl) transferase
VLVSQKIKYNIFDLGRIDFLSAYEFQKNIFLKVKTHLIDSAIILCEHNPVITIGRSGREEEIKITYQKLKERNIELLHTDRGGKTTYHGPGQLVIYFIFDLRFFKKDLHYFLNFLENLGILFLNKFGIVANSKSGFRGVWVNNRKIISIGISVKNWITYHGISINVKEEVLDKFSLIYPCGLDLEMTSLESILKKEIPLSIAKEVFLSCFKEESTI